ncbi:uncharacterized protein DUF2249 [Arcticibacter tournemirensis]|uniref:DUF2249 domain-containing protein n=1 Tax=Arcticibacter tournemirensis TaxID=699437 RepID=A0A5M9HDD9_9SPHI|nr:DUF2249 domain-containing protein [Arcticibacter tournemirensis]KAA8484962.1 DUF2249 domain-containing protein [Arcticibacter tournemirensis]TQM50595.1 uncharacterized protein DUF2249 [Arcticibacter tournemirensis]
MEQPFIIDRNTTIKQLLDFRQEEVIAALTKLNKNFNKLRNPVLRKILARRVSISDACKIAGCNIHEFLRTMENIGFQLQTSSSDSLPLKTEGFQAPAPEATIELDVRPVLAENKDPLKLIMLKANELKSGQYLKIINTFEPLPLINLLSGKGFSAHTQFISKDLIHTYFHRTGTGNIAPVAPPKIEKTPLYNIETLLKKYEGKLVEIDVTMFEMPKPMLTILEKLEQMKDDEALFVHHKKVPVYLLPHLREKGYEYVIQDDGGSKVTLFIYKL